MIFTNVHRNKFHQELVNAGIEVISAIAIDDSPLGIDIIFGEDVDMNHVQKIIDAHDPTPLPQPKSEVEKLKEENRTLKGEIATLQGAVDFIIMNY